MILSIDTTKDDLNIVIDLLRTLSGKPEETTRPKQKTPAKPKPTEAEDAPASPATPVTPSESDDLTLDDVLDFAKSLMQSGHKAELKAALEEFGAAGVSKLEPGQYRQFMAKLEGLNA